MLPILLITIVGGVLAWELTQGKLSTFLGSATPSASVGTQAVPTSPTPATPPVGLEMRKMPPVYSDVTASHGVPLTALVTQQATGIAPNLRTVALPYLGSRIL